MAGHSKFKNIQYRKGAQDKKRAKQFAKIGREIQIAVKIGGTDPESNPRLRLAINNARSVNMPKDNVDRAINKIIQIQQTTQKYDTRDMVHLEPHLL